MRRSWVAVAGVLSGWAAGGCLPQHLFSKDAAPVEKTVALIESSSAVADVLGPQPSVSLWLTKEFKRDAARAGLQGRDQVRLLTTVTGPNGDALLDLDALNIDGQGWSGRFSLRAEGRQVLRDGNYVAEGARTLLEGSFLPDGTPRLEP